MFAPVTYALDTLLTYVAVQGYLALLRYTDWVWQCGKIEDFSLTCASVLVTGADRTYLTLTTIQSRYNNG